LRKVHDFFCPENVSLSPQGRKGGNRHRKKFGGKTKQGKKDGRESEITQGGKNDADLLRSGRKLGKTKGRIFLSFQKNLEERLGRVYRRESSHP